MLRVYSPKAIAVAAAVVYCALSAPDATAQTTQMPASAEEMEAIYQARADSARSRFSTAGVEFVSSMIHHHAQAITMAGMAPTHGASPTVRTLAARIINGQRDEIATMGRWLSERGQPVPEVDVPAGGMADPSMHGEMAGSQAAATAERDHAEMPGMLKPEQMAALDAARGTEFDRLFLAMMIFHHRGAVTMVEELFARDQAPQDLALVKLASDVMAEQTTEIERMAGMLKTMTGSPLGPALIDIR